MPFRTAFCEVKFPTSIERFNLRKIASKGHSVATSTICVKVALLQTSTISIRAAPVHSFYMQFLSVINSILDLNLPIIVSIVVFKSEKNSDLIHASPIKLDQL